MVYFLSRTITLVFLAPRASLAWRKTALRRRLFTFI
jgi:hypothetical protein